MSRRTLLLAAPIALLLIPPAAAQPEEMAFQGTVGGCANGHQVRLEGSRRYVVGASSEAFDTVLSIYRAAGDGEALAEDDDGGEGTNSRIEFLPPETGDYRICVASFRGSGGGSYNVSVRPAAPLPPPVSRPSRTEQASWQVFEGALTGSDQPADAAFDDYEVRLGAGERALISLESSEFDPVVEVYAADRRGAEPLASDDDGGGALNAFLVLAPQEPGTFVIRVRAFSAGETGAYRLRVSTGAIPQRRESSATASETSAG